MGSSSREIPFSYLGKNLVTGLERRGLWNVRNFSTTNTQWHFPPTPARRVEFFRLKFRRVMKRDIKDTLMLLCQCISFFGARACLCLLSYYECTGDLGHSTDAVLNERS